MSFAALPAARSAPKPPLPARVPPVRMAAIERPSSNADPMRVAQRKR
jgi:hypothetical protein